MPYKYSTYLKNVYYNKILDYYWYDELKEKLNVLEDNKIKININELNKFLYDRYCYEHGESQKFNDKKYDLEKYMQIIIYRTNPDYSGYFADDEAPKYNDHKFNIIMNELSTKLSNFTMAY